MAFYGHRVLVLLVQRLHRWETPKLIFNFICDIMLKRGDFMSLGIGAFCKLIAEDEETVIYEYGSFNLNEPDYINEQKIADGIITIKKSSLIEPEIHDKVKRLPNGKKKLIVKRVPKEIHLSDLLKNNLITVENCSHCWKTTEDNVDVMAITAIRSIFQKYQENGFLPETLCIHK